MNEIENRQGQEQDQRPAPFTEALDPVTGTPFLLLDPGLTVHRHEPDEIRCNDAASFVACVQASEGDNKLVELRRDALFTYKNALACAVTVRTSYLLNRAETFPVLCLSSPCGFGQRNLVRWNAQWPGTLIPQCNDPEAAWEHIAAYEAKGSEVVAIEHGDEHVSVQVERRNGAPTQKIPRLWEARSPVYEGYSPQTVTLMLDIEHPEVDAKTSEIAGALTFNFSLWRPAATEIHAAAIEEVQDLMQASLGNGFRVIRGQIESKGNGDDRDI